MFSTNHEREEITKARNEWVGNAAEFKRCEVIVTDMNGKLVREEYPTIADAMKANPWISSAKSFMRGKIDGNDCFRFESPEAYRILSE